MRGKAGVQYCEHEAGKCSGIGCGVNCAMEEFSKGKVIPGSAIYPEYALGVKRGVKPRREPDVPLAAIGEESVTRNRSVKRKREVSKRWGAFYTRKGTPARFVRDDR